MELTTHRAPGRMCDVACNETFDALASKANPRIVKHTAAFLHLDADAIFG